jgi:hypothetical protein
MAILAALGVAYLVHNLNRNVVVATLLVVALIYPSVMVISGHGALDNPVFEQEQTRLTYTEQEVAAVYAIGEMTGSPDSSNILPRQVLRTDHPYQTVFARTGSYPSAPLNVSVNGGPTDHPITVYRSYQSTGAPNYRLVNDTANASVPISRTISKQRVCRPSQSVLYNNGDVVMCANQSI